MLLSPRPVTSNPSILRWLLLPGYPARTRIQTATALFCRSCLLPSLTSLSPFFLLSPPHLPQACFSGLCFSKRGTGRRAVSSAVKGAGRWVFRSSPGLSRIGCVLDGVVCIPVVIGLGVGDRESRCKAGGLIAAGVSCLAIGGVYGVLCIWRLVVWRWCRVPRGFFRKYLFP